MARLGDSSRKARGERRSRRPSRSEREAAHREAVEREKGVIRERLGKDYIHGREHLRKAEREGNHARADALEEMMPDIDANNRDRQRPVAQARRDTQRRASEDARKERERRDQEKVSRLVEQGRSRAAGIRPDRFGDSGDGSWNPGLGAPTKRRNRGGGRPPHV